MQQFNKDYPQQPDAVLTSGWFEARMLFFLKNKQASWDNIYIEYDENVNREMGVDVPESFVAQTKVKIESKIIFQFQCRQKFHNFIISACFTPP